MEWIIKIEGKSNQRILVKFNPMYDELRFIGQYKPYNKEWVNFSEESYGIQINLETIQDLLFKVYEKMSERLKAYKEIAEGFEVIKLIEIKEIDE